MLARGGDFDQAGNRVLNVVARTRVQSAVGSLDPRVKARRLTRAIASISNPGRELRETLTAAKTE